MRFIAPLFALLVLSSAFTGCAHNKPLVPIHDEVLVYDLPYDITYLRVLDALQHTKEWSLENTEKENGIISVRNLNYKKLDESEKRTATFIIKRVDRGQTSVELAPQSHQVIGVGELMKLVSQQLNDELKARG